MLMNYHIGRLVLSSLCVGVLGAADIWWCSFCRLHVEHIISEIKYQVTSSWFFIPQA